MDSGGNKCPIDGCPNDRSAGNPVCGSHWALVPTEVRKRVFATRDRIYESTEDFAEWQEACDVAIVAVEEQETAHAA